jgi:hypothetical protein
MSQALVNSLTEKEARLLAETEAGALTDLDEEELLDLQQRVRRARKKYLKIYRRRASAQVGASGGRGHASPKNQRHRDKAEVFELALARVSRRVADVSQQAADELRELRLTAARARPGGRGPGTAPTPGSDAGTADAGNPRAHRKTTGGLKRDASSRAQGAKRQATRDSR